MLDSTSRLYRPSSNEVRRIKGDEVAKRRRLRIQQVRNISVANAALTRSRYREKQEELLHSVACKIQVKMSEKNQNELFIKQSLLDEAAKNIGKSHEVASEWRDPTEDVKDSSIRQQSKAKKRFALAYTNFKRDKAAEESALRASIRLREAALKTEKVRAAAVAALVTGSWCPHLRINQSKNEPNWCSDCAIDCDDIKPVSTVSLVDAAKSYVTSQKKVTADFVVVNEQEPTGAVGDESLAQTRQRTAFSVALEEEARCVAANQEAAQRNVEDAVKADLRGQVALRKTRVQQYYSSLLQQLDEVARSEMLNQRKTRLTTTSNTKSFEGMAPGALERRCENVFEGLLLNNLPVGQGMDGITAGVSAESDEITTDVTNLPIRGLDTYPVSQAKFSPILPTAFDAAIATSPPCLLPVDQNGNQADDDTSGNRVSTSKDCICCQSQLPLSTTYSRVGPHFPASGLICFPSSVVPPKATPVQTCVPSSCAPNFDQNTCPKSFGPGERPNFPHLRDLVRSSCISSKPLPDPCSRVISSCDYWKSQQYQCRSFRDPKADFECEKKVFNRELTDLDHQISTLRYSSVSNQPVHMQSGFEFYNPATCMPISRSCSPDAWSASSGKSPRRLLSWSNSPRALVSRSPSLSPSHWVGTRTATTDTKRHTRDTVSSPKKLLTAEKREEVRKIITKQQQEISSKQRQIGGSLQGSRESLKKTRLSSGVIYRKTSQKEVDPVPRSRRFSSGSTRRLQPTGPNPSGKEFSEVDASNLSILTPTLTRPPVSPRSSIQKTNPLDTASADNFPSAVSFPPSATQLDDIPRDSFTLVNELERLANVSTENLSSAKVVSNAEYSPNRHPSASESGATGVWRQGSIPHDLFKSVGEVERLANVPAENLSSIKAVSEMDYSTTRQPYAPDPGPVRVLRQGSTPHFDSSEQVDEVEKLLPGTTENPSSTKVASTRQPYVPDPGPARVSRQDNTHRLDSFKQINGLERLLPSTIKDLPSNKVALTADYSTIREPNVYQAGTFLDLRQGVPDHYSSPTFVSQPESSPENRLPSKMVSTSEHSTAGQPVTSQSGPIQKAQQSIALRNDSFKSASEGKGLLKHSSSGSTENRSPIKVVSTVDYSTIEASSASEAGSISSKKQGKLSPNEPLSLLKVTKRKEDDFARNPEAFTPGYSMDGQPTISESMPAATDSRPSIVARAAAGADWSSANSPSHDTVTIFAGNTDLLGGSSLLTQTPSNFGCTGITRMDTAFEGFVATPPQTMQHLNICVPTRYTKTDFIRCTSKFHPSKNTTPCISISHKMCSSRQIQPAPACCQCPPEVSGTGSCHYHIHNCQGGAPIISKLDALSPFPVNPVVAREVAVSASTNLFKNSYPGSLPTSAMPPECTMDAVSTSMAVLVAEDSLAKRNRTTSPPLISNCLQISGALPAMVSASCPDLPSTVNYENRCAHTKIRVPVPLSRIGAVKIKGSSIKMRLHNRISVCSSPSSPNTPYKSPVPSMSLSSLDAASCDRWLLQSTFTSPKTDPGRMEAFVSSPLTTPEKILVPVSPTASIRLVIQRTTNQSCSSAPRDSESTAFREEGEPNTSETELDEISTSSPLSARCPSYSSLQTNLETKKRAILQNYLKEKGYLNINLRSISFAMGEGNANNSEATWTASPDSVVCSSLGSQLTNVHASPDTFASISQLQITSTPSGCSGLTESVNGNAFSQSPLMTMTTTSIDSRHQQNICKINTQANNNSNLFQLEYSPLSNSTITSSSYHSNDFTNLSIVRSQFEREELDRISDSMATAMTTLCFLKYHIPPTPASSSDDCCTPINADCDVVNLRTEAHKSAGFMGLRSVLETAEQLNLAAAPSNDINNAPSLVCDEGLLSVSSMPSSSALSMFTLTSGFSSEVNYAGCTDPTSPSSPTTHSRPEEFSTSSLTSSVSSSFKQHQFLNQANNNICDKDNGGSALLTRCPAHIVRSSRSFSRAAPKPTNSKVRILPAVKEAVCDTLTDIEDEGMIENMDGLTSFSTSTLELSNQLSDQFSCLSTASRKVAETGDFVTCRDNLLANDLVSPNGELTTLHYLQNIPQTPMSELSALPLITVPRDDCHLADQLWVTVAPIESQSLTTAITTDPDEIAENSSSTSFFSFSDKNALSIPASMDSKAMKMLSLKTEKESLPKSQSSVHMIIEGDHDDEVTSVTDFDEQTIHSGMNGVEVVEFNLGRSPTNASSMLPSASLISFLRHEESCDLSSSSCALIDHDVASEKSSRALFYQSILSLPVQPTYELDYSGDKNVDTLFKSALLSVSAPRLTSLGLRETNHLMRATAAVSASKARARCKSASVEVTTASLVSEYPVIDGPSDPPTEQHVAETSKAPRKRLFMNVWNRLTVDTASSRARQQAIREELKARGRVIPTIRVSQESESKKTPSSVDSVNLQQENIIAEHISSWGHSRFGSAPRKTNEAGLLKVPTNPIHARVPSAASCVSKTNQVLPRRPVLTSHVSLNRLDILADVSNIKNNISKFVPFDGESLPLTAKPKPKQVLPVATRKRVSPSPRSRKPIPRPNVGIATAKSTQLAPRVVPRRSSIESHATSPNSKVAADRSRVAKYDGPQQLYSQIKSKPQCALPPAKPLRCPVIRNVNKTAERVKREENARLNRQRVRHFDMLRREFMKKTPGFKLT